MICIVPNGAGSFCCNFTAIPEFFTSVLLPAGAVLGWFPCKADRKGEPSLSFGELLCFGSCRDEFCGLQWELCSGSVSHDPAMVLRGRRQKAVYPSVELFRSYSSLNLQQVPSCDYYLYSPPGTSSSKPQTTAQKSNNLLKHSRFYITGTVTRQ